MNHLFVFILLVLPSFLFAQLAGKDYLDNHWRICLPEDALYKREYQYDSSLGGYAVKVYRLKKNALVMEGTYASLKPEIPDGDFTFFYTYGEPLIAKGKYISGKMAGTWLVTYTKNNVTKELHYTTDTSSVYQEDHPEKNPEVGDTVLNEVSPHFNPDFKAMVNYIREEIVYPPLSLLRKKSGKAYVRFVVGKDGTLSTFQILKATDPDLAWEAVRIISGMPKWTPGTLNGKNVKVRVTVPIKFNAPE